MKFVKILVKTSQNIGKNLELVSLSSQWVKYERNKSVLKKVISCVLMNLSSNILRIVACGLWNSLSCLYIYIYIYMYICICICIYIYISVCVCVCMCVCMYIYLCILIEAYISL